jgi:hypothetical protein
MAASSNVNIKQRQQATPKLINANIEQCDSKQRQQKSTSTSSKNKI